MMTDVLKEFINGLLEAEINKDHKDLLDAGYTVEAVKHFMAFHVAMERMVHASEVLVHMARKYDSIPASKLLLAFTEFTAAHNKRVQAIAKIKGREGPTDIEANDALQEARATLAELEARVKRQQENAQPVADSVEA